MRILITGLICLIHLLALAQQPLQPRLYTMREGLSQMKTTCMIRDSRDYLWIGTRNGLNSFNGQTFQVYGQQDGLAHSRVHEILESPAGDLWILTYGGLSRFNGAEFENWERPFLRVLNSMVQDGDGRIWIREGTDTALVMFDGSDFHTVSAPIDGFFNLLPDTRRGGLYLNDEHGYYWWDGESQLDTLRKGESLHQYVNPLLHDVDGRSCGVIRREGAFHIFYLDDPDLDVIRIEDSGFADLSEHRIAVLHQNRFWLPDEEGSYSRPVSPFTLPTRILSDPSGGFWVAAENGVGFIPPRFFSSRSEDELPYAWSTVEDRDGRLWFGSFGFGLYRLAEDEAIAESIPTPGIAPTYFAGACSDPDGRLYFAHLGGVLMRNLDGELSLRQGGTAFHLAHDDGRDVLLSGTFGSLMVTKGTDTLAVYGPEQGVHENDYILAVGVDAEGQYWGGSYEGLCRINPETGKVRNFTGDSLPGQGVYCIYTDTSGTTWFGGDEGLLYYDKGRKRVMPVQSEVLQSIVKAIAPLDENRLLVAAKDGLYIFHHREYKASYQVTFQLLNENSGYPDIEPGFNGLFVASDGRIWVTSASGVSALDPKKLSLQGAALGVRITEVDGARQPFNVRSDWIPLEYGRDEVEIVFEAIGFQRPSRTLYQYRLDGNEWTDWSEVDRVFLSNLREGRHQFEVRAGPSDQYFVGTPYDKFYFEVSLPFWREAWFAPIAIVFAAGLLIFGLTALWNQRQNRIQLEARLNEVRQLRSQLLLAELNPHFVFNALASIQHQVLLGDREAAADHLVRLSRLIRSFLQATHRGQELAAGVAERDISLAEELTLLGDYLHFERLKNEQHFDYKIEVDPGIDPQTTFVPPMMLQPFVENGIKHGLLPGPAGGLLSLHFTYLDEEGQQLRVMITDNGVGIQEKTERKKFPNQESLGRSIIEERVRLLNQLGYSIRVETRPAEPKGTKVIIDFRELD